MAADRQAQPSQVNQMFARIILALTLALFAAPAMAAPANAGCVGTPLLAMTYNIRLDTPADGDDAWPHRRHAGQGFQGHRQLQHRRSRPADRKSTRLNSSH